MDNNYWLEYSVFPYEQTLLGRLGIEIKEVSPELVIASMPIDQRTVQPMGVAHGGALISLAETLASYGTGCTIDPHTQICVGQEINASLIRPVPAGTIVEGRATVLHKGRSTMIWDVKIYTAEEKVAAVCRCSIAIRPKE